MASTSIPETDDLLGQLLRTSSQAVILFDLDLHVLTANKALLSLIGSSKGALSGITIREICVPASLEIFKGEAHRVVQSGTVRRFDLELARQGSDPLLAEIALEPLRSSDASTTGLLAFVHEISERRKTEDTLRQSHERFRRLYDEAPFGYHEIDADGRIVNINRTECEMLGYRRDEMLGRSITEFVAEDEREFAREAIRRKVLGDLPLQPLERTYQTCDGRQIVVAIQERYRTDAEGRVIGIRSTLQDVTERKQTEAALIASERRARAVFEGIEDAVFVHDLEGRILDANPAACKRLGYSRQELLKLNTRDLDAPEFAREYEERLRLQLERGRLSFEGMHQSRDGRIFPVDVNTSTILFEDNLAILAVIRDITERKALEESRRQFVEAQEENTRAIEAKNRELSRSELRYRQLIEGSLDAIVVADREGKITVFNPAAERAFGYQVAEVVGKPLKDLIAEGSRRYQDVGLTLEMLGRRKNGETFPIEISLSAVDIEGEVQYIGSIRDQTERQRMRSMLARSEKLASIGLLSAGVAHEINNPLAFVANNLAVLERDFSGIMELILAYESSRDVIAEHDPAMLQKINAIADDLDWAYVRSNLGRMLNRTREGVQRVAGIVQNLRSLARTSPPKKELALVSDVVGSAIEMIQGTARRKGIEIQQQHESGVRARCVATQISQVVLNLLVNSLQAVEAAGRSAHSGRIEVRSRAVGDQLVLTIQDNGGGIPQENLPRLFDPFFTTKPVGEGTGLGLSISHGIVTGHGGRIEVESEPGVGTSFQIIFPLDAPDHVSPQRQDAPASPASTNSEVSR